MAVTRVCSLEQFEEVWPTIEDDVKATLDRHSRNPDIKRIIRGIVEQKYTLWVNAQTFCITQVMEWDGETVCCFVLVGGDLDFILGEGMKRLTEYAAAEHCKGFIMFGRPGWRKVLGDAGFEFQAVVMFGEI